jgi:glycosyltransferase involved in cell wall biosynthesis
MHIYSEVAGAGIDFPINTDSNRFIKKYDIHDDFIIYIGRIDESKGCKQLFEYFLRYKSQQNSNLKLVLLGKQIMKVPNNKDIIPIGFVTDEDKYNGIMASKLMVTPSKYESLSLVTLEAWICKRPVLVNGGSTVLKGHCIKSNAGLWYEDYDEFKESLDILLASDNLREKMGINGTAYVENNYNWKIIEQKYIKIIEQ